MGYHTGEFVKIELGNLVNRDIIGFDKDFAVIWDDCDHDIKDAVFKDSFPKLFKQAKDKMPADKKACWGAFSIPGWVGNNEAAHSTCVFSTLDLSGDHLGASGDWKPDQADISC